MTTKHENWSCLRCGHDQYEMGTISATGGALAKFFDVQNKKFATVTCSRCQHTELYRADSSQLENIFDLFSG